MTDQPGYQPPSFDKPDGSVPPQPPTSPAGGSYAAPAYGSPQGYSEPGAGGALAGWGLRAESYLIDYLGPALLASVINSIAPRTGWIFALAALGWGIYNAYLGGTTGQSTGRKIAGTRLISEQTGAPIGGGLGIGRFLLHILDIIPCFAGFFAPLFTPKKQTFTDMILKTLVVKA